MSGFAGWGFGYNNYAPLKGREQEDRQGKNYYIVARNYVLQIALVRDVVFKIFESFPAHRFIKPITFICNWGPLLSFPLLIFAASVRQGDQEKFAKWTKEKTRGYIRLPEQLGKRSVSCLSFVIEQTGNICRAAMVAGSVALIALGHIAFGGAVLIALSYQFIDSMGYIPRRISALMESILPKVSYIGKFLGGSLLIRVLIFLNLPGEIFSSVSASIHQKVDAVVRFFFRNLSGYRLADIDSPYVEKKQMTFEEINVILESNEFVMNPAHCSHPLPDIPRLKKEKEMGKLLSMFDSIDWAQRSDLIQAKVREDDRFLDVVLDQLISRDKSLITDKGDNYLSSDLEMLDIIKNRRISSKKYFEVCINNLAVEAKKTLEVFLADWLREQMASLVHILQGKVRVEGTQRDLQEAIDQIEMIIPHIESMDPLEKEDALLKLAIEGGQYCARGIKRASSELLSEILQIRIPVFQEERADPVRGYEIRLLQTLQNMRLIIYRNVYQAISVYQARIPSTLYTDLFCYDFHRNFLALGFLPFTTYERWSFDLSSLFLWEINHSSRKLMFDHYQENMHQAFAALGEVNFGVYLQQIIHENSLLTDNQKEMIIDKFTECNGGKWTYEETLQRYHHLVFVRLGVNKPPQERYRPLQGSNIAGGRG